MVVGTLGGLIIAPVQASTYVPVEQAADEHGDVAVITRRGLVVGLVQLVVTVVDTPFNVHDVVPIVDNILLLTELGYTLPAGKVILNCPF